MIAGIFLTLAVIATIITILLFRLCNTEHMIGILFAVWGIIGAIVSIILWVILLLVS